jgi:hypothetical protein
MGGRSFAIKQGSDTSDDDLLCVPTKIGVGKYFDSEYFVP